jgi:hypothetical protein
MTCREIPLTQGKVALVDEADYAELSAFKWCATLKSRTFYAQRSVKLADGRWGLIMMHRAIMNPAPGLVTDHINRDGLDNRRANLRVCTHSENRKNSTKRRGASSQFLGVAWYKQTAKWHAQIAVDGRRRHLGFYTDEIEAARAYDAAAIEHHGAFALPNFSRVGDPRHEPE